MNSKTNNTLSYPYRLITCILPQGEARIVLEKLRLEKGITTANIYRARGTGSSSLYRTRFAIELEKDMLTVLVSRRRATEIFNFLYYEAQIDKPHSGIIYVERVARATDYMLPEPVVKSAEST
ncbi:hypothetical protein [Beggiatoa leptomitoformis]|uniref:P-II family nitrogen regulator n=1 Tax=Beggiatoa leptomitoformis TaxID=288004 RepID=A0A2N9YGN5_9GAMM|nr:hypothetical protein [Beggiatoa leptomitoformis]ALG68144.1 hypothetical protein AL038_11020 [Beggiatoa leptomitoformis]AUI69559.1 hypothetical protein BLE401_13240 [Beggiatoa leptomitoformis]